MEQAVSAPFAISFRTLRTVAAGRNIPFAKSFRPGPAMAGSARNNQAAAGVISPFWSAGHGAGRLGRLTTRFRFTSATKFGGRPGDHQLRGLPRHEGIQL